MLTKYQLNLPQTNIYIIYFTDYILSLFKNDMHAEKFNNSNYE